MYLRFDKAATQGGDGEYSYAATTAVVGSELEPKQKIGKEPGSKKKVTEDESAPPEKPKRRRKNQPALQTCPTSRGQLVISTPYPTRRPQR